MHIKDVELIERIATDPETGRTYGMFDTAPRDPFALDMTRIDSSRSLDKDEITLAYDGPLPECFTGTTDQRITMQVSPVQVRVSLVGNRDGQKVAESLICTVDEIKSVLFPFFYTPTGMMNTYRRRKGKENGLSFSSNEYYRADFNSWERMTECPSVAICKFVRNLDADKRASVYKAIERMKAEEQEEAAS